MTNSTSEAAERSLQPIALSSAPPAQMTREEEEEHDEEERWACLPCTD